MNHAVHLAAGITEGKQVVLFMSPNKAGVLMICVLSLVTYTETHICQSVRSFWNKACAH